MKPTRAEFDALVRQELLAFTERSFYELNPQTTFIRSPHLEVVCAALEECRRGEVTRLIINMPPRSLKSHCASIAFVAFLLGHNPASQIITVSYAQDLANSHAMACRTIMCAPWYQRLFPGTRLSSERQAVSEFRTTRQGFRLSTSVSGVLTGRGAEFIIIDDPLKPEDALSDTQRKVPNDFFDHTLYSRLNDKRRGCIVLIMHRLHQDDLTGHVLGAEPWKVVRLPAIAEQNEIHTVQTPYGTERRFERRAGEALDPQREPLERLQHIRSVLGEYHFSGQYQQIPAPLGGGLVRADWFKSYGSNDLPSRFDLVLQSWDSANKASELNDYSVCTTWGIQEKRSFLLNVYRKRVGFPELKRAVREHAEMFSAQTVLIEDRASGTQLIQELINEGMYCVKRYDPLMEKTMRLHSVTSVIENGFVYLPDKAVWLGEYLLELTTFPRSKYDDQVDSTSQALDWLRQYRADAGYTLLDYYKNLEKKSVADRQAATIPESMECPQCKSIMRQRIPGALRCAQCGLQWPPPEMQPRPYIPTRKDWLDRRKPGNGLKFRFS